MTAIQERGSAMPMLDPRKREVWFLTGSQHLYGDDTLKQVAEDSRQIAEFLDRSGKLPVRVVWKPTLTGPDEILNTCIEANSAPHCVGVVTWMHTFSPAKMWIAGLTRLEKPLAHLHTQFNRELPWAQIDMDFMNLNQSAHGDREFGFIGARLRLERKIVVGHWQDEDVLAALDDWSRAACAASDSRKLKIARFGGMNMREVAVTGGDRVEAQIKFGWSVNGYGVGDLVGRIADVSEVEVDQLAGEYGDLYTVAPPRRRLLHGGLHLSPRQGARARAGCAHARGLPLDRRGQAVAGSPSAGHRRQGRSVPARVRRCHRTGDQRHAGRHGRAHADDRARGGRREGRA